MKAMLNNEFDLLVGELRKYESVRGVSEDRDGQVARAISWLKKSQRPGGYWGEQCMLATQMSLLALGLWESKSGTWTLADGSKGGVSLAFRWLASINGDSPGWDNNIWDTSAILQAAAQFGFLRRSTFVRAKTWIESRENDNWGLDRGSGIHYVAQAAMAMVACNSPGVTISKARVILLTEAEKELRLNQWTPYAAGQVLSALVICGANPADKRITDLSERLLNFLLGAEITIANWLHLCSAFRGLSLSIGSSRLEHPDLQASIQRLFSPDRVREDGSWYRDVTMTAWALVALESIRSVRRIDTFSFQIFNAVERTRVSLIQASCEADKSNRLLLAYGTFLPVALGFVGSSIYIIWASSENILSNQDVIFFILPSALGLVGFILGRVWKLIRS